MSIQGKVIVFTGKISGPRHEFQALVEEHGGIAGPDVTKSTSYLVVGEKPGTKLIRATNLGIPIISEEQFLKMLEEDSSEPPKEEYTNPCGTGPNSISHFWFRKTVKDNRDIVEDCLCGATLITHPNGTWEKHEPRYVIEQARKIAHQHAVEEERLCRERQRQREEAEKQVIKQLEVLSQEDLEQLERQLNGKT